VTGGPHVTDEAPLAAVARLHKSAAMQVALVSMPWAGAGRPSIQIGLLRAICERAGFPTDCFHLNLELAARLGVTVYEPLCEHRGRMTGEWLFSVAAFGADADRGDAAYFAAFPEEIAKITRDIGQGPEYLSSLRRTVLPRFIDDCAASIDWGQYGVVGFSSTFQQNVASLALARLIKERYPTVTIVLGGANAEGEMGAEYARVFPFIDYVVVGEGDVVFPAFLRALAAGEPPADQPGLVKRAGDGIRSFGQAPAVSDLDALPTPSYDEYFERAARLGLLDEFPRIIPFESSRGCWWGAKHHCTFCGLNGLGLAYRSKRPARVLAELTELAHKHGCTYFEAVDNILDPKYVNDLFAIVEQTRTDYQFFYELKANLTRDQIRTMARGGVRVVQPGIESLSTRVLQLMRKGCTMLQNVRLLKWARYYQIDVHWNLLYGFPGEQEEDYHRQLAVLKEIVHLQPPRRHERIWLERFAPYFTDRDTFPVRDVRPDPSYRFVYPARLGIDLDTIAYFFEFEMNDTVDGAVHAETAALVKAWQERWVWVQPPALVYRRTLDSLLIDDGRGPERQRLSLFQGPLALLYEFCSDTMRTGRQAVEHLAASGSPASEHEVGEALAEFCRLGLMVSEDDRYLSLALPAYQFG
jgi:ribosomal peptide maturation radical SAM protein 1